MPDFGSVDRLPSGKHRARYRHGGKQHTAGTYATKGDAWAALADVERDIKRGAWVPPGERAQPAGPETFGAYAERWLAERTLAARTRDLYRSKLDQRILSTFRDVALTGITAASVRAWHAAADPKQPTARAHAYALLRTILAAAVADELIPSNPARIVGAGTVRRAKEPATASLAELDAVRAALPSDAYRVAFDLGLWCSLRIGEVCGLQRADIDPVQGLIHVRRATGRAKSGPEVKAPKSRAGVRDVTIPDNILPALRLHMTTHAGAGRTGWVFPSSTDPNKPLTADVLREAFEAARTKAGRPDLRFHDLRGIGATRAARSGATVRELQDRLGHATPNMALAYQRVAETRPRELARLMAAAALAEAEAVKAKPKARTKRKPTKGV